MDNERWLRHDVAQLFIPEETFPSGVIGKAYVNELCGSWAVGVVADHSPIIPDVAATGSHEMGHNFGLGHDDRFGHEQLIFFRDGFYILFMER